MNASMNVNVHEVSEATDTLVIIRISRKPLYYAGT